MALGDRSGKRHPAQAREFRPENTAAPNQQRSHPVTWNGATGVLAGGHLLRTQRSPGYGKNCKGASESSAGILPAVVSASRARRWARRPPDSRRDGGATNTVTAPFPATPRPAALLRPSHYASSETPHPESPDSASLPLRVPGTRPRPARPLQTYRPGGHTRTGSKQFRSRSPRRSGAIAG